MNAKTELDNFTKAYITAALWSTTDNSTSQGGDPLDKNYGPKDIAPEALEKIAADCAKFQADNASLIDEACQAPGYQDIFARHRDDCEGGDIRALAGHDFWLTRNGHGAGFWDRGLGDVGDRLSDATKVFGECWLYVGDDGKLWIA